MTAEAVLVVKNVRRKPMEDFEISIKIAVYTPTGEFIRQLGNASLSDETMALLIKDVAVEVDNV